MDSDNRLPAGIPEISVFHEVPLELSYVPQLLPRFGWLAVLGQGTVTRWQRHHACALSFVCFPQ